MRKYLLLLFLLISVTGWGDSGMWTNPEGVNFWYSERNGGLSVAITSCEPSSHIEIPTEINGRKVVGIDETGRECKTNLVSVTIPEGISYVGWNAFDGCSNLTSIVIADTVTSIGSYAFRGCKELTSVSIPRNVTNLGYCMFYCCSSLAQVSIPSSVTSIGSCAFYRCNSLTQVFIPSNVTSIGSCAFYGCTSLSSVKIPDMVANIGINAFYGCEKSMYDTTTIKGVRLVDGWVVGYDADCNSYLVLDGIRGIVSGAFEDCKQLVSVTLPNGMLNICDYIFEGCSELTEIAIPNSVTNIGWMAFKDCSSLSSITIPDSVVGIGANAFEGTGLTSVIIPDSVRNVGSCAFGYCNNLSEATIPDSVFNYQYGVESVFGGSENLTSIIISEQATYIAWGAFQNCDKLTSVSIPDSVTEIKSSAFDGCDALYNTTTITGLNIIDGWVIGYNSDCPADLTIEGVRGIADEAFRGCENLASVYIAQGVKNVGSGTFSGCNNLNYVSIPEGVTSIGWNMFGDCSSLSSVSFPSSITNMGEGVFVYCRSLCSADIPSKMKEIPGFTFYNCTSLSAITIPEGITDVGISAFQDCEYLNEVNFSSTVTNISDNAFANCRNLNSIVIPSNVETIGNGAFDNCGGFEALTIANGVKYIKAAAFRGCSYWGSLTIPGSVIYIGDDAFWGCYGIESVEILNGVITIGASAFNNCRNLTSVVIPDSVTYIGNYAFKDCGLSEVSVSGNTVIGDNAFDANVKIVRRQVVTSSIIYKNLKDATNPNPAVYTEGSEFEFVALNDVPGFAFAGWMPTRITSDMKGEQIVVANWTDVRRTISKEMVSVFLPDGDYKYDGTAKEPAVSVANGDVILTELDYSISYSNNVNAGIAAVIVNGIGNYKGSVEIPFVITPAHPSINATLKEDGTIRIDGVVDDVFDSSVLVIPDMIAGKPVTEIADRAFIGLASITSVTLPIFLERIGRRAFHNATSLKVLNIPAVRNWKNPSESGSLTIGEFAFAGTLLGEVRLPEEVTKIGNKAFNGCQRLTSVTILGAPSVGEDVFCNAGIAVSKSPTLRLSPDLAADEAYLSKLTSNFGRANLPVTVRTDAIVESVAPKGISVASDGSIELPVAVGRAANWGEVDTSKVSVEYREKLTDAPTALEPRVKSNEGGLYSISVTPPKKASSGFFRVKVLK